MAVFIAGFGLFLAGFVIHVLIWRIAVPHRQGTVLALLFLIVGLLGCAALLLFGAPALALSPLRLLLTVILFGSFAATYIILFSAVESDSPTLAIIELIQRSGRTGVGEDEIVRVISAHSFLQHRLDQMLSDGMAFKIDNRIFPGKPGLFLTTLILRYRKLLRRNTIGG